MTWPPEYTIRVSARAKRLSLRVGATRGLEVVLPRGVHERHVAPLLEQHRDWIEARLGAVAPVALPVVPEVIELAAVGEVWRVAWSDVETEYLRLNPNKKDLVLHLQAPLSHQQRFPGLFKAWLQRQAKRHLPGMLDALCEAHGFEYRKLSIRLQKTRWGSCSEHKHISLNAKLLLMPRPLAEHIMLHELCHTVHMNHSQQFWALLSQVDPHTSQHHPQSRQFKTVTTQWLESS